MSSPLPAPRTSMDPAVVRLLDALPDAATVVSLDQVVLHANTRFTELFGYAIDEVTGRTLAQSVVPRDSRQEMAKLVARGTEAECALDHVRLRRKDGGAVEVQVIALPFDAPARVCLVFRDVTVARRSRETIRQLFKAVETMQIGLTITDLDGTILYVNPADARLHGWAPGDLIGQDVSVYAPGGKRKPMTAADLETMTGWERETTNVRKDGSTFVALLLSDIVRDDTGEPVAIVTTCEDITDRKQAEERLYHDAFHDGLTGLPNRAMFIQLLERAMTRLQRRGESPYALLFLDLDRFKVVNDSLGHSIGDQLLVEVARRLKECVRPGDVVARLGGDEFTVLLERIEDPSDATRVAARMIEAVESKFLLDGHELYVSTSVGIALGSVEYDDPEDVLRDADIAMYRAKSRGVGRYEVFDTVMHAHVIRQLALETGLRRALEQHEFRIHYQPILSLRSGRIVGLEALLRWQHPERGLLHPSEFVPLAEETGLIVHIGWWTLEQACAQLAEWQARFPGDPPLAMNVNLSPLQFQQMGLVERVSAIAASAGVLPHTLRLEITESALMRSADANVTVIEQLRVRGIPVLIDDFGTGYSSLAYLQQFRVSTLKIDRSFVSSLTEGSENFEIVRTIIALARALGLTVVAEGVETEEEHRHLRTLGCDEVQGFLFSAARDVSDVSRMLATQP